MWSKDFIWDVLVFSENLDLMFYIMRDNGETWVLVRQYKCMALAI